MRKRWKSITALCLAAMIGCILPMGTMMAAEDDAGVAGRVQETEVQESPAEALQEQAAGESPEDAKQELVTEETAAQETEAEEAAQQSETDEVSEEAVQKPEVAQQPEIEEPEIEVSGEEPSEATADEPTEEAPQETGTVQPAAEAVEAIKQSAKTTGELDRQEQSEKTAPVIVIRLQGADRAQPLGGKIAYDTYISNHDQRFNISIEQGSVAELYYYLDTAANASDESKSEELLAEMWQPAEQGSWQEILLGQDGRYVLYVKAVAPDGQTLYARTDGIVIDAAAPVITGINNGGTYPEGTAFGVTDDNLESVLINEQPAEPSAADGMYQVAAAVNSTSCVIRAKDKAGNETVYSITVNGEKPDIRYIWESGTYELKSGRDYHLGPAGNWQLEGDDKTVYKGGSTFYVSEDGSYRFEQHFQ